MHAAPCLWDPCRSAPPLLRRALLEGLLGDLGCALVLLLSPLELQLAPPIPREDLTTALPSSCDRSMTLSRSLPDSLSESSPCSPRVPSGSSPTLSSVASLVAARHPNALPWETEAGWLRDSVVRGRTEVTARVGARARVAVIPA